MVKKQFGLAAGLTAALVLAVTPITIATERNNTMDGMLVFALLLAAHATSSSLPCMTARRWQTDFIHKSH